MKTAFADESFRQVPAGLYLLAAIVVPDDLADDARSVIRAAIPPHQARFHWHDEREERRLAMLRRIAELPVEVIAHCCHLPAPNKQERGRALVLRSVLWSLNERGIDRLVIESRRARNDRRDQATIGQAQRAGHASAELRYGFERASVEPLLWAADAAAGAASAYLAHGVNTYLEVFPADRIELRSISP